MTPSEFDITNHVTPGKEHEVTVQVYRFSDGEAMETIDMFRYSGIYRSVHLFSTPEVHVRDFDVTAGLDEEDEYGIDVMDEVYCETHWWEGILAQTTAYHEQAVERFRRMLLRDRS
ncbi:sugar-binding domain-containing protein [Haladaptatus paucihalophilus]|uniref:beta-galactosidase n=1 Tax=Haladaptatus paucihalophilus DX253 TaxID=797209 RepID=A0A1M6XF73_HALPU|nr:sugar-binding domain-containing protein [Haladaptatus paucihalophilus]SHL04563.1 Glycosyl hydrolases family 2, sugar binding domain [Haladaptatus paucihalophilus DX253]